MGRYPRRPECPARLPARAQSVLDLQMKALTLLYGLRGRRSDQVSGGWLDREPRTRIYAQTPLKNPRKDWVCGAGSRPYLPGHRLKFIGPYLSKLSAGLPAVTVPVHRDEAMNYEPTD